jgi:hypothetical protein
VATTSDGAIVIVKFGKLSPALQHLCYIHAIHLVVASVFYNTCEIDLENDDETELFDENCEKSEEEIETMILFEPKESTKFTENSIVIKKNRKIVKIFKNSPVRNNVLQSYVKKYENKQLNVLLDIRTR